MSADWQADVREFHAAFSPEQVADKPGFPAWNIRTLRRDLITEEWNEIEAAFWSFDLPKLADGIADAIYVLLETAEAYGIKLQPIWDAVHAANMAKLGGGRRADGKVMKPEGWQAPDIAGLLREQGWEG